MAVLPAFGPRQQPSISDYGNASCVLCLGDHWVDTQRSPNAAPHAEHFYRNRHTDYLAHGLQLAWQLLVSSPWRLGDRADTQQRILQQRLSHRSKQLP